MICLKFNKRLLFLAFIFGPLAYADSEYDLKQAIAKGNPKKVRQLLKRVKPEVLLDNGMVPALVYAAEIGNPEVVMALIEAKAPLDARIDQYQFCPYRGGATALIIAACEGHGDVVRLLIEARASLDMKTLECESSSNAIEKISAVACAASREHREIYDMLIEAGAKDEFPLHAAVEFGDTERVQSLIDSGVDVDARDGYLYTPIMSAAERGHTEIVRLLLQAKATPDIPRNSTYVYGRYPLFLSLKGGHLEITKLLLAAKADPNIKDMSDKTPLWLAVEARNAELVKLLIEAGADVQFKNRGGESLLQLARRTNADSEIVRLLTASGTK